MAHPFVRGRSGSASCVRKNSIAEAKNRRHVDSESKLIFPLCLRLDNGEHLGLELEPLDLLPLTDQLSPNRRLVWRALVRRILAAMTCGLLRA